MPKVPFGLWTSSAWSTSCSSRSARSFRSPCEEDSVLPGAEVLVGQIQRDEDRQAEHVGGGRGVGGRAHLLVDVRGELGDVGRVQAAADRIPLPGDFNRDDAAHAVCFRQSQVRS